MKQSELAAKFLGIWQSRAPQGLPEPMRCEWLLERRLKRGAVDVIGR